MAAFYGRARSVGVYAPLRKHFLQDALISARFEVVSDEIPTQFRLSLGNACAAGAVTSLKCHGAPAHKQRRFVLAATKSSLEEPAEVTARPMPLGRKSQ